MEEKYKYYLTRGGFIQDYNGKWCKEGDKVRVADNAFCLKHDNYTDGVLKWNGQIFSVVDTIEYRDRLGNTGTEDQYYPLTTGIRVFELLEPCKPDICEDIIRSFEK